MNKQEQVKLIRNVFSVGDGAILLKALWKQFLSDHTFSNDAAHLAYGLSRVDLVKWWQYIVDASPAELDKLIGEEQDDDRNDK